MNEWLKLPGLFYRFEFEQVIEVDGEHEYRFEKRGTDDRGSELVAIFCRVRASGAGQQLIDLPLPPIPTKTVRGAA